MEFKADNAVSLGLLLIGAVFVIAGVISGESGVVFEKEIRICMECIGIG